MKHTPAPWEIFNGREIKARFGTPSMDRSQLIPAIVSPGINADANANLIAAAPNLLAACKKIIEFHDEVFRGRPLCIDGIPIDHTTLNEAYRLAEIAVKKAEGVA